MIQAAKERNRAVSEVIGSVLLIVIMVFLVVTIGGYIISSNSGETQSVQAGVDFIDNNDNSVTIKWTERLNADSILASNGTKRKNIDTLGETVRFQPNLENSTSVNVYAKTDEGRISFLTSFNFAEDIQSTAYMKSSTCDSIGTCDSTIVHNNSKIYTNRGINILAFDKAGNFHSYAWYNTASQNKYRPPTGVLDSDGKPAMSSTQTCDGCVNARVQNNIDGIPNSSYIILVGDGQPGRDVSSPDKGINTDLEQLYERMGAKFSGDSELQFNDSWILVVEKTSAGNYRKIFEEHSPRGDQGGKENVTAFFYAPQ